MPVTRQIRARRVYYCKLRVSPDYSTLGIETRQQESSLSALRHHDLTNGSARQVMHCINKGRRGHSYVRFCPYLVRSRRRHSILFLQISIWYVTNHQCKADECGRTGRAKPRMGSRSAVPLHRDLMVRELYMCTSSDRTDT
jgi:hypothetical protein